MFYRHTQILDTSVSKLMFDRLILKSFAVAGVNIFRSALHTDSFELGLPPNQMPISLLLRSNLFMYSKTGFKVGVIFLFQAGVISLLHRGPF